MDAMVDSHYQFGLKKVALALEADHLKGMTNFLAGMGCEVQAAISATRIRGLDELPAESIFVGDLEDLEEAGQGADLLVANSQRPPGGGETRHQGPPADRPAGFRPARRPPEDVGRLPGDDEPGLRGGEYISGECKGSAEACA